MSLSTALHTKVSVKFSVISVVLSSTSAFGGVADSEVDDRNRDEELEVGLDPAEVLFSAAEESAPCEINAICAKELLEVVRKRVSPKPAAFNADCNSSRDNEECVDPG
jgi:hypothetical protein